MTRRALPALLLALACNPGFDPQYRVTDLRILAVHAEVTSAPPQGDLTLADVDLDGTLQLTALVENPQGRPGLAVTWYACTPTTDGSLPPCIDPTLLSDPSRLASAGALLLGAGSLVPGTADEYAAPPIALPSLPAEVRSAIAAGLQAVVTQAQNQASYRCRVYVEVPVVVVAAAAGKQVAAVKRVRVVQRPADVTWPGYYLVNQNPLVDDAYRAPSNADSCLGGTPVDGMPPALAYPLGRTTLCARARATTPPEAYNLCSNDGSRTAYTESYGFQWYVSGGDFPDEGGIGNATGTSLDFERPAGAFTLWLVVRDGRGGDSWKRIDVPAAP